MKQLLVILLFLFVSCTNPEYVKENPKQIPSDSLNPKTKELDSLTNPSSYYYLSDKPLEKVAQLMLIDSIYPMDNKITFDCLDSISSNNSATRDFYFKVMLKILDKSDGCLSEAVGSFLITYIESYTKEFAERLTKMDKKHIDDMADFTGYELYFEKDKGKKWLNNLNKLCKDCDSTQTSNLRKFKTSTTKHVNEIDCN